MKSLFKTLGMHATYGAVVDTEPCRIMVPAFALSISWRHDVVEAVAIANLGKSTYVSKRLLLTSALSEQSGFLDSS